jgi:methylthioribose-1-phosphate isomerase
VPFYVALPSTTIDWEIVDGITQIPIEQRDPDELVWVRGRTSAGESDAVEIAPSGCPARNDAFDVTPSRLVTAFVTERGVCDASEQGLVRMFPDLATARSGGAVAQR